MKLRANVLISLGSNMGDRVSYLRNAIEILREEGFEDVDLSGVYETPPWGFNAETSFYNLCAAGYIELSPSKFMKLLIETEEKLGRTRNPEMRYTSRTLDLDIILWDTLLIDSPLLNIPHPRAHLRRFVLEPAAEIVPEWKHPLFGKSIKQLLGECEDNSPITWILPTLHT